MHKIIRSTDESERPFDKKKFFTQIRNFFVAVVILCVLVLAVGGYVYIWNQEFVLLHNIMKTTFFTTFLGAVGWFVFYIVVEETS